MGVGPDMWVSMVVRTDAVRRAPIWALLALAVTLIAGCGGGGGGGGGGTAAPLPRPAPSATSVAPSSAVAGRAALAIRVRGASFVSDSTVLWNGAPRPTTYLGATELEAVIPPADLAIAGPASVAV